MVLCAVLHAGTAEARFGKAGSGGTTSGGNAGARSTHAAVPVDSPGSSSTSSSSSGSSSSSSLPPVSPFFRQPMGYFGGAFVPMYGYGYAYPEVVGPADEEPQAPLRATAGLEFLYFTNQDRGYSLGLNAAVEGERFGVSISAHHLSLATDDGSDGSDTLQQLSARVGYTLLSGDRGRVRAELGADVIFAADVVVGGPTIGFSGTLWIAGPLAFEASMYGSVYPFWQLDGRAGLVVGMGALGFRLGWRTQLLDDQGVVDGVAHRDIFMGPYAGLGFAF